MIGILSLYYKNHNYGGQLQAAALQKCIQDLNPQQDVLQVSYVRPNSMSSISARFKKIGLVNSIQIASAKIAYKLKMRMDKKMASGVVTRDSLFESFANSIPHTEAVTEDCLADLDASLFVVGSDQVWTLQAGRDVFLARFPTSAKKVSYAASMGGLNPSQQDDQLLIDSLDSFTGISLRERNGFEHVQSLMPNGHVELVVDPTLLLSPSDWRQFANYEVVPTEPYLFVYALGEKTPYMKSIYEYAHSKGLKVLSLPHMQGKYRRNVERYADILPYEVGPAEWLALLDNAKEVCTDSFHGVAFSINFKKPFAAIKKGGNSFNNRDDRLKTIMSFGDAEDMVLGDDASARDIQKAIAGSSAFNYEKLDDIIKQSKNYLKRYCVVD